MECITGQSERSRADFRHFQASFEDFLLHLILDVTSVGIDLKELGGGQLPKCLKFCEGLKLKADFHSKMSVCRQELGVQPPTPDNSNPGCNACPAH